MQETRMIEQSIIPAGHVSAKAASSSAEPGFGRVLSDQQQSSAGAIRKTAAAASGQSGQVSPRTAGPPDGKPAEQAGLSMSAQARAVRALQDLRRDLQELLRTIDQGDVSADGETDLQALVERLVQRLDSADWSDQPVSGNEDPAALADLGDLAGVENLVEQLQVLEQSSGPVAPQELAAELVAELQRLMAANQGAQDRDPASGEAEVRDGEALLDAAQTVVATDSDAESERSTASTGVGISGPGDDSAGRDRSSARFLLQQAVEAVAARHAQSGERTTRTAGDTSSEMQHGQMGETAGPVDEGARGETTDPRFAGLLRPRHSQGRESAAFHHRGPGAEPVTEEPGRPSSTVDDLQRRVETTMDAVRQEQAPGQQQGHSPATRLVEQLLNPASQHAHQPAPTAGGEVARVMPQTPVVPLTSGQTVTESQIFDQVVTRMAGSFNGQSGRMVLRLHPAELGSLKLDLKVEGDRVQAHLHAQTHQVQEVLERNLPQLRSALAEQGLKIDQFQVDVDQRQAGESFADLDERWSGRSPFADEQEMPEEPLENEESVIPLAHLMGNGGRSISLHV